MDNLESVVHCRGWTSFLFNVPSCTKIEKSVFYLLVSDNHKASTIAKLYPKPNGLLIVFLSPVSAHKKNAGVFFWGHVNVNFQLQSKTDTFPFTSQHTINHTACNLEVCKFLAS